MRKVSLDKVQAGMVVARPVYSLDGIVLESAEIQLTLDMIAKLNKYGVFEIYIEDDYSKGLQVSDVIKEELATDVKMRIKQMMTTPSIKISIEGKKVVEIVDKLINDILSSDSIIASLSDIRSIDDYTFSHCVNVCLLSLITGIGMGFKGDVLKELGVGSILHDIGKVLISDTILQKPGSLTLEEFNEVKKHTIYGYEILKRSSDVNATMQTITLSHHERMDGSGYPYNLKGSDIPLMARIVAIADVYDALTTNRVYRKKMLPHEVVDYMCLLAGRHFDKSILDTFIRYIAHYPIGTGVVLNSGEKGLVSRYNTEFPNRPVIRVVIDETGKMLIKHKEVDLSKKIEYRITEIWDI